MSVVPDYVTPIEAWRVFNIDGDHNLCAIFKDAQWPVREPMRARCLAGYVYEDIDVEANPHKAPDKNCECGIWALKDFYVVGRRFSEAIYTGDYVVARVALWGDIQPAEDGYKAEFAYPLKLWAHEKQADRIAVVAERYGVPFALYITDRGPQGEAYAFFPEDEWINDAAIDGTRDKE